MHETYLNWHLINGGNVACMKSLSREQKKRYVHERLRLDADEVFRYVDSSA